MVYKYITYAWNLIQTVPNTGVHYVFVLCCIFPLCVHYTIVYMLQVFGWVRWCSADIRKRKWLLLYVSVYVTSKVEIHCMLIVCLVAPSVTFAWLKCTDPLHVRSLFVNSGLFSLQIHLCDAPTWNHIKSSAGLVSSTQCKKYFHMFLVRRVDPAMCDWAITLLRNLAANR
jgi:hypothetical protein